MSCEDEMLTDDNLLKELKKNASNRNDVVEEIFNDSDGADDPGNLFDFLFVVKFIVWIKLISNLF